jgi:hypothetical protein
VEPEPARITEIDVSAPARLLTILRWSDYALVVVGGLTAIRCIPDVVTAARAGSLIEVATFSIMVIGMGFAAYTGWRHVGVIDPRVWRSYLLVFPFLTLLGLLIALSTLSGLIAKGWGALDNLGTIMALANGLYYAGVAVPGFICVLLMGRARVPSTNVGLKALLESLAVRGHGPIHRVWKVPRSRLLVGVSWLFAGLVVVVICFMIPLTTLEGRPTVYARFLDQFRLFGFFLIVRARRYFQVSAESLLAVDKRAPVLFLRSFSDDEKQTYSTARRALLDFSLETRLANHFSRFGPFIAIGAPNETVPEPGAARIRLKDDEWQSRVLRWMGSASLIVMYGGKTHWVNWELRRVIESRAVSRLILMFPEIKGWRSSRRKADIAARVEHLREVFKDTPWNEELMEFNNFPGARAMLFRPDGSMDIVKSRSRSRDAYHLAALVAHYRTFQPPGTVPDLVPQASLLRRRAGIVAIGLAAAVVLLVGVSRLSTGSRDKRLVFKKGELYYSSPVTEAQAKGVGDDLVRNEYFTDEYPVTVKIARRKDTFRLLFVVNQGRVNEPLLGLQFGILGSAVSREALAGAATEVVLCDTQLTPVKVLPRTDVLTFGKASLFYTAPVTEAQARAAGTTLLDGGYFANEREVSVELNRDDRGYELKFVVNPARASEPEVVAAFSETGRVVAAKALQGQPLRVDLCDGRFEILGNEKSPPESATVTTLGTTPP